MFFLPEKIKKIHGNMQTAYLHRTLATKSLKKSICQLISCIKDSRVKFDAIAFRGFSGAMVAPSVAVALNKQLILVRKDGDICHSYSEVEGCSKENCKYIIVDDFVCLGHTIEQIIQRVDKALVIPKIMGVFLYYQSLRSIKERIKCHALQWDFPIFTFSGKIVPSEVNVIVPSEVKKEDNLLGIPREPIPQQEFYKIPGGAF